MSRVRPDAAALLDVALAEARSGLDEGGIPIGAVVIGEARTFSGGHHWLAEHGVAVSVLDDERCVALMTGFIDARPELWHEDIGEA